MIITQENSKRVVESHDFDSVNCTIDAEDMRYVASLLRNNYSNPTLAVVREISANALDANTEANASRNIEVTIPSSLNPHFVVRDFGGGLSKEDVFGLYSKYGKSTKRESNNYIGAFGIGKFAPLSYGSNFTCVSYHGGKKTSYNVFVNEDDDTKIVELHSEPSSEPTGLSVEVAVSDDDVNKFKEVCKEFFRFFSQEEMPKFIGVTEDEEFFDKYEVIMESNDSSWFILDDKRDYWAKSHHHSHAIMGRVHYPFDPSSVNWDSFRVDDSEQSNIDIRHLRELASQENVYIRFDIGQLKLHHSRESLEYNKNTQQEIVSTLRKVQSEIQEIAKEKLGNAEDLWDAMAKYAQVINAFPHGLRSIFENAFEWDGIKISDMRMQRDYKWQDDLIITEYWKDKDSDATDGYKCRSQKSTYITPAKNTALVIQDIKSNHGNALRVRTLFQNDENLDRVYIVYPASESAETYLFDEDGMRFSKINKERFQYSSLIEKAKLQSKGRAVQGESRSSVPLFELDLENVGRHYRNADYWLNCQENIDDLELRASDPDDRGLIYVPIANYKIVEENATGQEEFIALDSFERDVKAIRSILKQSFKGEDEDFQFPMIVGVRRKDCSKLDKDFWSCWEDFKKYVCKDYLLNNKKKVVDSEKARAYSENRVSMEDYSSISGLLDNSKFRNKVTNELDEEHIISVVANDLALMSDYDNSELQTISRMINFLKKIDQDWVDKNIPSTYDMDQFNNNCKQIIDKYPLLVNISREVYSWRSMEEDNLGKNLIDYVLMCDLVGEGN
jgi:hypothetical protein